MPTKIKQIGSFSARDDEGRAHRLEIFARVVTEGDVVFKPAMRLIKTADGKKVNHVRKGEYKVVETGLLLHSDDPHAP